jgi:hypothetical protein
MLDPRLGPLSRLDYRIESGRVFLDDGRTYPATTLEEELFALLARALDALRLASVAMNHMGDALNAMEAVSDEDIAATTPAFEAVARVLVEPAPAGRCDEINVDTEERCVAERGHDGGHSHGSERDRPGAISAAEGAALRKALERFGYDREKFTPARHLRSFQRGCLCRWCVARRLVGEPDRVDPLHPFGRCECGGEDRCAWCVESAAREKLNADVVSPVGVGDPSLDGTGAGLDDRVDDARFPENATLKAEREAKRRSRPRYLTPAHKAAVLAEWAKRKSTPRPQDARGGHGYPDPGIFDLCDRLNAIDGVCTLQSCAGHSEAESDGGLYPANLWLWLAADQARGFERAASQFQVAMWPTVDRLAKHWQPDGQEVVEISFVRHDHPAFRSTCDAIVAFVSRLDAAMEGR